MTPYNPQNERVKHDYFVYVTTAGRLSPKTQNQARKAIVEFEKFTEFECFMRFNKTTAIAYKKHITNKKAKRSGELIKATTLKNFIKPLIKFLRWLAFQPKYKSRIVMTDIDYLDLSDNESRAAIMPDFKHFPTLEMLKKAVMAYPKETEIQKRDAAMIAFVALTASRGSALMSLKLRHVDMRQKLVKFFASDGVDVKFGKNFITFFFPTLDPIFEEVFTDYMRFLREEKFFDINCPLFPKTLSQLDEHMEFTHYTLGKEHLASISSVQNIFDRVLKYSGLEYYNPHSLRDTIAQIIYDLNLPIADTIAMSGNLGHSDASVTVRSYGQKMSDNERQSRLRALDRIE